jgi:hypothetical protein
MHTDAHGLKTTDLSVCICVHPWLMRKALGRISDERLAWAAVNKKSLAWPNPHRVTQRVNRSDAPEGSYQLISIGELALAG